MDPPLVRHASLSLALSLGKSGTNTSTERKKKNNNNNKRQQHKSQHTLTHLTPNTSYVAHHKFGHSSSLSIDVNAPIAVTVAAASSHSHPPNPLNPSTAAEIQSYLAFYDTLVTRSADLVLSPRSIGLSPRSHSQSKSQWNPSPRHRVRPYTHADQHAFIASHATLKAIEDEKKARLKARRRAVEMARHEEDPNSGGGSSRVPAPAAAPPVSWQDSLRVDEDYQNQPSKTNSEDKSTHKSYESQTLFPPIRVATPRSMNQSESATGLLLTPITVQHTRGVESASPSLSSSSSSASIQSPSNFMPLSFSTSIHTPHRTVTKSHFTTPLSSSTTPNPSSIPKTPSQLVIEQEQRRLEEFFKQYQVDPSQTQSTTPTTQRSELDDGPSADSNATDSPHPNPLHAACTPRSQPAVASSLPSLSPAASVDSSRKKASGASTSASSQSQPQSQSASLAADLLAYKAAKAEHRARTDADKQAADAERKRKANEELSKRMRYEQERNESKRLADMEAQRTANHEARIKAQRLAERLEKQRQDALTLARKSSVAVGVDADGNGNGASVASSSTINGNPYGTGSLDTLLPPNDPLLKSIKKGDSTGLTIQFTKLWREILRDERMKEEDRVRELQRIEREKKERLAKEIALTLEAAAKRAKEADGNLYPNAASNGSTQPSTPAAGTRSPQPVTTAAVTVPPPAPAIVIGDSGRTTPISTAKSSVRTDSVTPAGVSSDSDEDENGQRRVNTSAGASAGTTGVVGSMTPRSNGFRRRPPLHSRSQSKAEEGNTNTNANTNNTPTTPRVSHVRTQSSIVGSRRVDVNEGRDRPPLPLPLPPPGVSVGVSVNVDPTIASLTPTAGSGTSTVTVSPNRRRRAAGSISGSTPGSMNEKELADLLHTPDKSNGMTPRSAPDSPAAANGPEKEQEKKRSPRPAPSQKTDTQKILTDAFETVARVTASSLSSSGSPSSSSNVGVGGSTPADAGIALIPLTAAAVAVTQPSPPSPSTIATTPRSAAANGASATATAATINMSHIDRESVRRMVSHLDRKDSNGTTLLMHAIWRKQLALIPILLNLGSSIHLVDGLGHSPLHLACMRGLDAAITELIQRGAPMGILNLKGKAPFELPMTIELKEIVRIVALVLRVARMNMVRSVGVQSDAAADAGSGGGPSATSLPAESNNTHITANRSSNSVTIGFYTDADIAPIESYLNRKTLQLLEQENERKRVEAAAAAAAASSPSAALSAFALSAPPAASVDDRNPTSQSTSNSVVSNSRARRASLVMSQMPQPIASQRVTNASLPPKATSSNPTRRSSIETIQTIPSPSPSLTPPTAATTSAPPPPSSSSRRASLQRPSNGESHAPISTGTITTTDSASAPSHTHPHPNTVSAPPITSVPVSVTPASVPSISSSVADSSISSSPSDSDSAAAAAAADTVSVSVTIPSTGSDCAATPTVAVDSQSDAGDHLNRESMTNTLVDETNPTHSGTSQDNAPVTIGPLSPTPVTAASVSKKPFILKLKKVSPTTATVTLTPTVTPSVTSHTPHTHEHAHAQAQAHPSGATPTGAAHGDGDAGVNASESSPPSPESPAPLGDLIATPVMVDRDSQVTSSVMAAPVGTLTPTVDSAALLHMPLDAISF